MNGIAKPKVSPPGYLWTDQYNAYLCIACGCICPDSWTILNSHSDFHRQIEDLIKRYQYHESTR